MCLCAHVPWEYTNLALHHGQHQGAKRMRWCHGVGTVLQQQGCCRQVVQLHCTSEKGAAPLAPHRVHRDTSGARGPHVYLHPALHGVKDVSDVVEGGGEGGLGGCRATRFGAQ